MVLMRCREPPQLSWEKMPLFGVQLFPLLVNGLTNLFIMKNYFNIFLVSLFFFLAYSCSKRKPLPLNKWQYKLIDSTRTGNDIVKDFGSFGMDVADFNHDGYGDILVGKYFYQNPGKDSIKGWQRSIIRDSTDNMFITNVDNDAFTDVVGLRCDEQYWFEATNKENTHWKQIKIGNESICSHYMSSMGYCKADVFAGGKPELLFTDLPGKIWCFEIPENPDTIWPVYIITENGATNKFLTTCDVDGDGDLDLVTGYKINNQDKFFNGVCWFENPGIKSGDWKRHVIGQVNFTADHFAAADFNGDGICEIIVTEGRWPEVYPAGIYMFTAPDNNVFRTDWNKSLLTTQYSTNSLEVADMDNDGDLDFVTGEHKGSCRLQIWENDGRASFACHTIDSLKESHNGAKLFDIDKDGDLDIITSGWLDKRVHLWINKVIN